MQAGSASTLQVPAMTLRVAACTGYCAYGCRVSRFVPGQRVGTAARQLHAEDAGKTVWAWVCSAMPVRVLVGMRVTGVLWAGTGGAGLAVRARLGRAGQALWSECGSMPAAGQLHARRGWLAGGGQLR